MGFDGSSITGFNRIEESDMIAMPDPSTFKLLPWRGPDHKVGRVFCDVLKPDGEPYEGDPRYVLKRALQRAKDMGFDHYYLGPELEFFLFKDDQGTEVLDKGGYFDLTTLDVASDFRRDVVFTLRDLGIPVEYTHHEVGPSQHEIDMRFADGLDMADRTMTYRIAVKEVAMAHGYYATFMPKPLFGENGSGMHTHQSLFKGDDNAFYDADDEYHLSDVAKSFIAGQLRHARELSALFAPLVNSYKRLVPGYEAPVYIAWSRRNRSALVRVPMYHPGKERATRMELRCPDPSCNPYLTFAALLQAGLEGIEKGYELPEPMERNLYDLTRGRSARARHRAAAGDARRGGRGAGGLRARPQGARRPHHRPLRRAEAQGVGRVPRRGHSLGARPLPGGHLTEPLATPEPIPSPRGAHLEMVGAVVAGEGLERVAEIAGRARRRAGRGRRAARRRARGVGALRALRRLAAGGRQAGAPAGGDGRGRDLVGRPGRRGRAAARPGHRRRGRVPARGGDRRADRGRGHGGARRDRAEPARLVPRGAAEARRPRPRRTSCGADGGSAATSPTARSACARSRTRARPGRLVASIAGERPDALAQTIDGRVYALVPGTVEEARKLATRLGRRATVGISSRYTRPGRRCGARSRRPSSS